MFSHITTTILGLQPLDKVAMMLVDKTITFVRRICVKKNLVSSRGQGLRGGLFLVHQYDHYDFSYKPVISRVFKIRKYIQNKSRGLCGIFSKKPPRAWSRGTIKCGHTLPTLTICFCQANTKIY